MSARMRVNAQTPRFDPGQPGAKKKPAEAGFF